MEEVGHWRLIGEGVEMGAFWRPVAWRAAKKLCQVTHLVYEVERERERMNKTEMEGGRAIRWHLVMTVADNDISCC